MATAGRADGLVASTEPTRIVPNASSIVGVTRSPSTATPSETAIAGLTEIFLYDADSRARLKAGSILLAYADAGLKLHPEPSAKERAYDQLTQYIEDSARKYEEAMGREPEQALIVEPGEEEAEPLVEVETEADPAGCEDEAPEPGEPATVEVSLVAEKLNPAVKFRMERVPGFFPPKFRRVPIEP